MSSFSFNKIIIIESLDNEWKTGGDLRDSLNAWVPGVHGIEVNREEVYGKDDWDNLFKKIAKECENNHLSPILHFEIHGEEHGDGLVLANGEFISNEEFGEAVRNINNLTGCNTFITLAVCHGLNILKSIHMTKRMPFCGALGSFDTLMNDDILLSYTEFYNELLTSFDVYRAFEQLREANHERIAQYGLYMADLLFKRVYSRYVDEECTDEALTKRAEECMPKSSSCGMSREDFIKAFKNSEKETRNNKYLSFRHRFFMLDRFPDNEKRFEVPACVDDLKF